MKSITKTLLIFEQKARKLFEQAPFIQALLAGIGVIIFWRGIWEWLDEMQVTPFASILLGSLILGGIGVFVQTFIGNTIIIKEVKQEEKLEQKAVKKIEGRAVSEKIDFGDLSKKIDQLMKKIDTKL